MAGLSGGRKARSGRARIGARPLGTLLPVLLTFLLAAGCLDTDAAGQGASEPNPAEAEVLEVVQALFDAMEARDPASARELLLPQGYFTSYRQEDGEVTVASQSHQDFLAAMETWPESPLERYWDPEVMIREGVAMAWTPYDFWWGGGFNHCGVNVFSLVQEPGEGWRIASIVYTVETTGCEPSPLGPPEGR